MKPCPLLTREQVKAILKIQSEAVFQALLAKHWIAPPVGRFKKQHLWCSATIYKLAERNQEMGITFNKKMTEDIVLERMIEVFNKSANS